MSVAELVSPEAEVGFAVEDGIQQSVRIVRLQVPAALAETEEAAGRPHSRRSFFSDSLDKIGADRLNEYVAGKGIQIYPRLEWMHYVEPEHPGGSYEGIYAFEVRPEIRLPDLGEHEIKVPDPDTGGDFYEKLIAALPGKMPEWEKVDRPCQIGDRLTLVSLPQQQGKSKPFEYVLQEGGDSQLHELFVGAGAGDVRTPAKGEGIQLKILKVERPIVPEFNLEFIQKIDPASKSREEFESSFRKAHASHMQGMINKVMLRRAEQTGRRCRRRVCPAAVRGGLRSAQLAHRDEAPGQPGLHRQRRRAGTGRSRGPDRGQGAAAAADPGICACQQADAHGRRT